MKHWSIKVASVVLSATSIVACSAGEQEIDKRQNKKAELTAFNNILAQQKAKDAESQVGSGDANPDKTTETPVVKVPEIIDLSYPALKLSADGTLASLKAADILLVNKINPTTFVIFGKDGKSWSYNPTLPALEQFKVINPIVVNPAGSTLYTLPENQFWFVSQEKLGRHKAAAVDAMTPDDKSVTVEQFSTTTFLGDKTKIKVLYAVADEIILHLGTHITIVTIMPQPAPAQIKQLPIAQLPVDLSGNVSAGRSANGYWLKSDKGTYFLAKAPKADASPWSKSSLVVEPAAMSSLAFWPDETSSKYVGASVGLTDAGLVSDVLPTTPASP